MHISKEPGMDEYLFITMAKLKADRLRLEREQRALEPAEEEPRKQPVETPRVIAPEGAVMRTTLTLTASVVINVVALAVLGWSVSESQLSPHGEVTITQLEQ
jgi:hypothetical protein